MTLEQANDILADRKDHWSHEIEEAEQTMIKAGRALASIHGYHIDIVKEILNKIVNKPDEHTCSECVFYREDCKWCMNAKCLKRWVEPDDEACYSFEQKKEEE